MKNLNRISEIEGLRGVAVLAIIFYHFFPGIFSGGYIGVDIFFVISGFVITKNLYEKKDNKNLILLFFFRRVVRLLPALFVVFISIISIGLIFFYQLIYPN